MGSAGGEGPHLEPHHLRQGDSRIRRLRPRAEPNRRRGARRHRRLLEAGRLRHRRRRGDPAAGVRRLRRARRPRVGGDRPRPGPGLRRDRGGRPPARRPDRRPQPLCEDPGHGRGADPHPADDRGQAQRQRDLDLRPRPLCRSGRGLFGRAGGGRGRPELGVERGLLLRVPGGHRGGPPPGGHRRRRGPGPARQSGGGQRQAGLPAVRRAVLRPPLGGPGRPGGPAPAGPVGQHLHQEPGLPRHPLRR